MLVKIIVLFLLLAYGWMALECRYDKPFLWFTWNRKRKYIRLF